MNIYISDLDGTLLNKEGSLSITSKDLLNEAIKNKINFTIATARTPATVINILKGVNITLPIITMNGATIYDIKNNKYIHSNFINNSLVTKIKNILSKHNIGFFIYTLKNNHLYVYHNKLTNLAQTEFLNNRKSNKYKTFLEESLPSDSKVLYFTMLDTKENIEKIYTEVKNIPEISIAKYKDVYSDCYNLEIYHINSTKAKAIEQFKNYYHFDKLITFGDNKNDIPMFNISDECYAVSNAVSSLKEISTRVIGSNTEDSVATFINNEIKKKTI